MKTKKHFYKLTAWLLTVAMLMTFISSLTLTASAYEIVSVYEQMLEYITPENNYGLGDTSESRIFHAWGWSYQNIQARLEDIAEQGFSTILVSPPNEIKMPTKGVSFQESWWMLYQPAGFQINESSDNALGTKDAFVELCEDAHDIGLKIMVEAVVGYVGTDDDHVGTYDNVSTDPMAHVTPRAWEFEYEILSAGAFHSPWVNCTYKENYWDGWSDYDIEEDLTQHAIDGKPDLATETQLVQDAIFDYFVELVEAGTDSFYFNDAKHIETKSDTFFASDFWEDTLVKLREHYPDKNLQAIAEMINGFGDGRSAEEYLQYGMDLTHTAMSDAIRNSVINGTDFTVAFDDTFPPENSVLWGESYKSYANGETSSLTSEQRAKIWALTASRKGTKGIYLGRPSDELAEGKSEVNTILSNITLGEANVTDWSTETVKRVNHFASFFEKNYENTDENVHYDNGIAVMERGGLGAVLVNMKGNNAEALISENTLADGEYTDAITGNKFTVGSGIISGEIGESGIAVLYRVDIDSVYNIWVGGKQFTSNNLTIEDGNGGTATYDPDSNTLTLNNVNITSADNYGIYADAMDGFTIALTGVNTVNSGAAAAIYVKQTEDYSGEALTITGDGSLNAICGAATAESYGIYAEGDVIVESGEVTATGGCYGVSAMGDIILNGGTTIARGETAAFYSAPTIADTFTNAAVWYGESESAANTAGAKDKSELANKYNQKYVKVAEEMPELKISDIEYNTLKIVFNANLAGKTATVIFVDYAAWDDPTFRSAKIVPITTVEGENTLVLPSSVYLDAGDKILIWENLTTIKPLCEEYRVSGSETPVKDTNPGIDLPIHRF